MNENDRDYRLGNVETLVRQTREEIASMVPKVDLIHESFLKIQNQVTITKTMQDTCPARNRRWIPMGTILIAFIMMLASLYSANQVRDIKIENDKNHSTDLLHKSSKIQVTNALKPF